GSSYIFDVVQTEKSYVETEVMVVPAAAENDGKCKCGANCTCSGCSCGH
ncbi:hypothetical protein ELJ37_30385, partial [Klebsiella pneumoniae]|nr:hypothetical protein [Klebsiella pneumoniae]